MKSRAALPVSLTLVHDCLARRMLVAMHIAVDLLSCRSQVPLSWPLLAVPVCTLAEFAGLHG